MSTGEELQKPQGEPAPTQVWVKHDFSHFGSSQDERAAFRGALTANGFGTPHDHWSGVGTDEEVEGDEYWHHWTFTLVESPDTVKLMDERAAKIAEEHGVQYDGWEVQRHLTNP